ncbi:MAG: hypothetical protein DHS20C11_30400 [Lysobacteraceae bacterium]|nr:MAG: hypothetical protein DHS20C11_30400 [Xanthomonadaceae bacterium]
MSDLTSNLVVGDRMPNFVRPAINGEPFDLYKDRCGQQVVLLVINESVIDSLSALQPVEGRSLVILICGDRQSLANRTPNSIPAGALGVTDGGDLSAFIRSGSSAPAVAVLMDRNMRVVHRSECQELGQVSDWWQKVCVCSGGYRRPGHAPVLIIPGVFEPEFCRTVIDHFHAAGSEPSGVLIQKADGRMVYQTDDEVKIRREQRLDSGLLLSQIVQRVERRVLPEIQWAFNYRVARYEGIKTVMYDSDSGGFFAPHRDNDGVDTAHRRFAMTLNLNSEEYEGGALRFPEYESGGYKPPSGSAVIFSCNLAHEALPITSGKRYAVISFLNSEAEVQHNVQMERQLGE